MIDLEFSAHLLENGIDCLRPASRNADDGVAATHLNEHIGIGQIACDTEKVTHGKDGDVRRQRRRRNNLRTRVAVRGETQYGKAGKRGNPRATHDGGKAKR